MTTKSNSKTRLEINKRFHTLRELTARDRATAKKESLALIDARFDAEMDKLDAMHRHALCRLRDNKED